MDASGQDNLVGVVLVGHMGIAQECLNIVQAILREPVRQMVALSVTYEQQPEEIVGRLREAARSVDKGRGVVVLTDMFGGTPSNISLSLLEDRKLEVVSGFNLPMVLKVATCRGGRTLDDVAEFIRDYGAKNIHVASKLLAERK
jgi:PTS system mannose-specific IIA component